MALSSRAKWGTGAAVLAVAVAGAAWVGSRPDAPDLVKAPVAAVSGNAKAQDKTRWKDLTPIQQKALEPLAGEWDQMEPVRKQKWLGIAQRWARMKPDEQARVQERMREWVRMTPEQRSQVRKNFTRAQKLDPTQKSVSWENYQQLSDEQKKQLAAKAATKKQVANLPTAAQSRMHTVAPIKPAVPPATPGVATPVVPPVVPATDVNAALPNASNVTPVPTGPGAPVPPAPVAAPATAAPASSAPPQPAPADVK
ncbi:DUF3106 domain-containing protein [Duganella callida]|uniref:DUF3106 domain-containing protein n=1 Tax=Duganella callida TaxID=2561932 RepID=A0A4Y9S6X4_9BURK|nr:DUF3106 domain-containing protein [Duganella callida]